MGVEKITIPRAIGEELHANHYIRNQSNIKDPLVIMCHGFTGDKDEHGRFSLAGQEFNNAGYDAIAFDFSGSGENKREPVTLSRQVKDVEDVVEWAKKQGYQRMGMLGLSFGGLTTLQVKFPERKAVVFWAPAFFMSRIIGERKRPLLRLIAVFKPSIQRKSSGNYPPIIIKKQFFEELYDLDPVEQLSKIVVPALIIQGQDDKDVKVEYTREAFDYMPQDQFHKMIEFPNCDHEFKEENTPKAIKETIRWFNQFLK
jgi:putative redox protein